MSIHLIKIRVTDRQTGNEDEFGGKLREEDRGMESSTGLVEICKYKRVRVGSERHEGKGEVKRG